VTPDAGTSWRVRVERASRERLTYWISITNSTGVAAEVDARYEIVVRT
jgi:hypothetical protein